MLFPELRLVVATSAEQSVKIRLTADELSECHGVYDAATEETLYDVVIAASCDEEFSLTKEQIRRIIQRYEDFVNRQSLVWNRGTRWITGVKIRVVGLFLYYPTPYEVLVDRGLRGYQIDD